MPAIPDTQQLTRLAALYGIEPVWQDDSGVFHEVPENTMAAVIDALELAGAPVAAGDTGAEAAATQESPPESLMLEPVYAMARSWHGVCTPDGIALAIDDDLATRTLSWRIEEESGRVHEGESQAAHLSVVDRHRADAASWRALKLPDDLDLGYHRVHLKVTGDDPAAGARVWQSLLIVAPETFYCPPVLREDTRLWGFSLPLESLRSQRNWGIGDLSDLIRVIEWTAWHGGSVVGAGHLHPLVRQAGPGGQPPASTVWWDLVFVDVEAVQDFHESPAAAGLVRSADFQEKLRRFREADTIDHQAVFNIKRAVLWEAYASFRSRHLETDTPRAQEFNTFMEEGGQSLYCFALYQALGERFNDLESQGWLEWPASYRDPDSSAVREFAAANQDRIRFFQYVQWQIALQLDAVRKTCRRLNLPLGLCLDVPVGVALNSAEVWHEQANYAKQMSTGCPPDDLSPEGEDWCLAPPLPGRLRESGYASFVDSIRQSMRYAGAVRVNLDNGLARRFWIPDGARPGQGAFVRYNRPELLAILCLESHRNECLVIADDVLLKRFPSSVPQRVLGDDCLRRGIFGHCALLEAKDDVDLFCSPAEYPEKALVTIGSSRTPAFPEYWQGSDLKRLGAEGALDEELYRRLVRERVLLRAGLLRALSEETLLAEGVTIDPASISAVTPDFSASVVTLAARARSALLIVDLRDIIAPQLPDALAEGTGTASGRKLPLALEDLDADRSVVIALRVLGQERVSFREAPWAAQAPAAGRVPPATVVPQSTYRLQFNSQFTFRDARRLVPYLARLGISHFYASPIFKARPGSVHGYDVADYGQLNPELGTTEDFDALVDELKKHGMGLVLDMVPNHMAIGKENKWWQDVLENGQASAFADYFDIDWAPLKPELQGKVLLPVLGDHYGQVLVSGDLILEFDRRHARLNIRYYDHQFPLAPASYPLVLGLRLESLAEQLGAQSDLLAEYRSILLSLSRLPSSSEPEAIAERQRERTVAFRRLSALCTTCPPVAEFIESNIGEFLLSQAGRQAVERAHKQLEAQSYRLSYWRVAADEINYRRFFDVNDLAAVRVENPLLFSDMHELVFNLVAEGKLDGLRIDHPDGLFDPAGYLWSLQREAARRLGRTFAWTPDAGPSRWEQLPFYVAVEKILAPFEYLKKDWAVHGTTGYDFLNAVNGVLIAGHNEERFTELYERFIGQKTDYDDLVYRCKQSIMDTSLSSELNVLAHKLSRISQGSWLTRDYTLNSLRHALREVVAAFPVYRTYVSATRSAPEAHRYINWAVRLAKRRNAARETGIYDFIRYVLLNRPPEEADAGTRELVKEFAMKFQQFSAPITAKSLEDTLFYRYNRFIGLNEVGGEPHRFGTTVAGFHRQNQERLRTFPYALLATSTHDTKRSEDVRARLAVLSEIPDLWQEKVSRWARLNQWKKLPFNDIPAPDGNDEYMLYQTLVGCFPLEVPDPEGMIAFRRRITEYMVKAVREAKVYTSWLNPDSDYEKALVAFIEKLLPASPQSHTGSAFLQDFLSFHEFTSRAGLLKSLTQLVLKLTSPGVPDIYQGTDLWDFSLVDPDNRRPVDFEVRAGHMTEMQQFVDCTRPDHWRAQERPDRRNYLESMLGSYKDGRLKLFLTASLLNWRRARPEMLTTGAYIPLRIAGADSHTIGSFARKHDSGCLVVVVPAMVAPLVPDDQTSLFKPDCWASSLWKNCCLELPAEIDAGCFRDIITSRKINSSGGRLAIPEMFQDLPFAVLSAVPGNESTS